MRLRLHAGDDEAVRAAPLDLGPERCVVKHVRRRLADDDHAGGRRDFGMDLPRRRAGLERRPARVVMLHVNDRDTGRARAG